MEITQSQFLSWLRLSPMKDSLDLKYGFLQSYPARFLLSRDGQGGSNR